MTKLAPEWVQTSDPVIRSPARYRWTTAPAEVAGGRPPAEVDISRSPDRLQTEISVVTTEMAGGSPPADIDICVVPDVLPIAMSVKTVMSDKSMEMDTPDGVVSRMEMTGGSPPAEIDISRGPDMLQTEISVTTTEMAGGSTPADIDICMVPDVLPTAMSVKIVMLDKLMEIVTFDAVVPIMEVAGGSPLAENDISGRATESGIRDSSSVRKVDGEVCHEPRCFMYGWLSA